MTNTRTADHAALLLRLTTGTLFLAHGLLKVLVFTVPGTIAYFESLGLPAIFAYLTIFAEIGGGLALILGIGTRIVSAALVPLLIGAAILGHGGNGWVFSNPGGGWEFPVFWAFTQISLVLLGDGAYAINLRRFISRPALA